MPSHGDLSNSHDVIVIGAGPAGEAAAELRGNLGYSVALVERDTVGGTVVTSGGAPTKTVRENTPTYTHGYKLAAADALARLHPDVLRAMRLPSQAHRI
jgi:pyruvate/2-oxoglutarate dehydrogenase complex dihydrolipoamide dehydrogenase (E3) component